MHFHKSSFIYRTLLAGALLASAGAACASSFGVSPLRIELGGSVRSAVVTVSNDSTEPLFLKVYTVVWDMDEAGKEVYAPTEDLAFYPKALSIPAGEKRVVRVASDTGAPKDQEKTYRLFLKETVNELSPSNAGAQVAMLVNFGVGVFIMPPGGAPLLVADVAKVSKGRLTLALKNTGQTHSRIDTINFAGQEPVPFGSSYVLAGHSRGADVPVSAADCAHGHKQVLELKTQEQSLAIAVDLSGACQ